MNPHSITRYPHLYRRVRVPHPCPRSGRTGWVARVSTKSRTFVRFAIALSVLAIVVGSSSAQAQKYSVVYRFGTNAGDPLNPQAPGIIAQGRDGNLYSTTGYGGTYDAGTVFKIAPGGTSTVLYSFDGAIAGYGPLSGLTLGTDGNFYGATYYGGTNPFYGTIFKIAPDGTLTTLHSFKGGNGGKYPVAPPIQGTDGNFYGTTSEDGFNGVGTVYRITPAGNLKTLYQLSESSGGEIHAPFVEGTDGNFYVATNSGGEKGLGTVFKITPKGKLTLLQSLGKTKGYDVSGPLVQGNDGNFYGTAVVGGTARHGTVFRIGPRGKFTVMHNFSDDEAVLPIGGLVQATDGNFYGTTDGNQSGTIYQITPDGAFSVLHRFYHPAGAQPEVTLLQNTNGTFYGDTNEGGKGCLNGCGVFYSFDMALGQFVSLVPLSGKVGNTVGILGQALTGTTAVLFNGSAATFTVESDTYLTAIVPTGASTGSVTVTTRSGTLISNKQFRVAP